jgi:signal transduction histidine kinase
VLELSLHILDVLQNSIEAGANHIELCVDEHQEKDILRITVRDNGRGMSREMSQRVLDPFVTTRTTRHVGLGLPLFAAAARRCNGGLSVDSTPGVGTTVTATFQLSHIDRAPLGDLVSTLLAVMLSNEAVDLHYRHSVDGRLFELDTEELRGALGPVPLSHPRVREWLKSTLERGLASLQRPMP